MTVDTSIAQPIWPTIGLLVALALLGGSIVGRAFGQWRMFVLATTAIWAVLAPFSRLTVYIDVAVLAGGMAFYSIAWFRERKRLMNGNDAEA